MKANCDNGTANDDYGNNDIASCSIEGVKIAPFDKLFSVFVSVKTLTTLY